MNVPFHLRFLPPPVYFIHIQKTGGVSLNNHIHFAYPRHRVLNLGYLEELALVSFSELKRFRCYLCHLGPGLYELVGRSDLPCITMVRDPVERAISLIHWRRNQVAKYRERCSPGLVARMEPLLTADLRTCLAAPEIVRWIDNGQTRILGTVLELRPFLKDGAIGRSGKRPFRKLKLPASVADRDISEIAASARRRLETMAVVGITERFDESVELVCDLLGIPRLARMPHLNVGPKKREVDVHGYRAQVAPDLIEQIEARTTYDQELYAYACELFEQQLARMRARPNRTYSIAPRLLVPGQRAARSIWHWLKRVQPGLAQSRALRPVRSWLRLR